MTFKQAERAPHDGPVGVERRGDRIWITCETMGKTQAIDASLYNAARIFGALAVILGIKLSSAVSKAIKF